MELKEIVGIGTLSIKLLLVILSAGFCLSALVAKKKEQRVIRLTIGTFFLIVLLWFHIYWQL